MGTENQKEEKSSERLSAVVRSLQAREVVIRTYRELTEEMLYFNITQDPLSISIYSPLMESTNVLDINKKEIFEGDIIEAEVFNTKVIGPVIKHKGYYAIVDENTEDVYSTIALNVLKNIKLIGDIFRNPELLE